MRIYSTIRNVAVSMLVLLGTAQAANLNSTEGTMKQMAAGLSDLMKAEQADSFIVAADKLIVATEASLQHIPSKLRGDGSQDDKQKDYQAGLQSIIDVTTQAKQQAEQGDLKAAKETVQKLYQIRSEYHGRYR